MYIYIMFIQNANKNINILCLNLIIGSPIVKEQFVSLCLDDPFRCVFFSLETPQIFTILNVRNDLSKRTSKANQLHKWRQSMGRRTYHVVPYLMSGFVIAKSDRSIVCNSFIYFRVNRHITLFLHYMVQPLWNWTTVLPQDAIYNPHYEWTDVNKSTVF